MDERNDIVQLTHQLSAGRLSRREFLRLAALVGLSLPAASAILAACRPAATEKEVNVISWAQEWENAFEPFQKETGVTVNNTFQSDPLETTNKLKASPATFDVVSYGPFDSPQVPAGVMQALDLDRVKEAWDSLHPFFRDIWKPEVFAPKEYGGNVYHLTFYWGSTLLAWNTDVVGQEVDTWQVLWDPKYKGQVAVIDQATEMWGLLSIFLGLDLNNVDEAQMAKNKEQALALIPNLKSFWSTGDDIKQWMATGEVVVAAIWDGTARALVKEGYPIQFTFPKEGVRGWIDGPGLVKDAPHPNAAYAFINYVMRPEVGVQMADNFLYAPANLNSVKALSGSTRELILADKVDTFLSEGRFKLQKPKAEDFQKLGDWWSNIRTTVA